MTRQEVIEQLRWNAENNRSDAPEFDGEPENLVYWAEVYTTAADLLESGTIKDGEDE